MKAVENQIIEFLNQPKTQFVIPVYQRNYDWKTKQCEQLLKDIQEANKEKISHFIGSIVCIQQGPHLSKNKSFEIIDGQQRLVTLTLLLFCIRLTAEQNDNEELAEQIYEFYLINKFDKGEAKSKIKLKATENNQEVLEYLLENRQEAYNEYSNIIENFKYFQKKINSENYKKIFDGLSYLMFVEVTLEKEKDDPQKIFESFNSTGLQLTQADLIRNYVLMKLERKQQEDIYKNYWEVIERNARDNYKNESKVSDFIRHYLILKKEQKFNQSKVYEEFKLYYPCSTFEKLKEYLKEITKFSGYYKKLINPSEETNKQIREQTKYINKIEITVSYPFLMQLYNDYERENINKETFVNILLLLQSYVWRRYILTLPTSGLNSFFPGLYKKIDQNDLYGSLHKKLSKLKGNNRFPKDTEIEEHLKTKDIYNTDRGKKNTHYFLEKLENHGKNEKVDIKDLTVEHIFPKIPIKWKKELSEEDYHAMKEKYLHTIANLTLTGYNPELSNETFRHKKDKEHGYKHSKVSLNKYLASLEKWDVKELKKRLEILYKRSLEIWKGPVEISEEEQQKEEMNIFFVGNMNNIEYIKFFGDKKIEKSIKNYYLRIFKMLFELEKERLVNSSLSEEINLKKKDKLRKKESYRFAPVIDDYYIEIPTPNDRKLEKIKKTLEFLELEDELIIKFQDIKNE